ncbi:calcium/sodium antiporter [Halomonas denitrificans]|uniref:calcium/sodium antiporter n=1 Tax=Halomonas TaxID=2745 RepID=UPI001C97B187|nr:MULTISPECIES: calcium/sodium antiporter [Halomonas]MBY5925634.1 calcium/sodium antiporter [Halomonas sp. DP4Y7-2]MBY6030642.1 calcium/sodium antiporter [Halomonas sp. DP8Y7-1]MBY6208013.1 calcium/sodium antiporter [Halomonas sp. DP3Y7-2]MBY6228822.1 calcium/sodium antiporter [Halomonas sp. DP3Y7-1]MBY6232547.1 calcium/sodium antiporter [Halomonas sp. DP4Y7-1]
MLLPLVAVALGLVGLLWSADRFVGAAAATAYRAGMSIMLVGMTIVSIGTSAPEIVVSVMASLDGTPDLATGNALGSNIANIALVLGVTALVVPIPVRFSIVRRELPLLLGATGLAGYALADGQLNSVDAALLLALLVFSIWWLFRADEGQQEVAGEIPGMALGKALVWLVVTLAVMIASSRGLVWGATELARSFGVSELVIGLTVVAIGTSLPELAACVASALKRHHDLAIGNVIGSNLFNMLAVLPVPGLLAPGATDPDAAGRDFPVMLGLTLALAAILLWQRRGRVGRIVGALLAASYAFYLFWLGTSLTA